MNVQAVELLANLKHEDAQDQNAHQHVEPDAELDDHRHAIGGSRSGKEQLMAQRSLAHLRSQLVGRVKGKVTEQIVECCRLTTPLPEKR